MRATVIAVYYVGIILLFVGCDPGMTIRQARTSNHSRPRLDTVAPLVTIRVKTTHQLFGEAWYDPDVEVINSLESPIVVTSIELMTQKRSYPNTSPQPENRPITIPPGNMETMKVSFRLDAGVHETFRHPAELRVHYLTGNKEEIARTTIVRGPLGPD